MTGHVYIVGAGPGNPDWITVAGKRAIEAADVILTDALVNPSLLSFVRDDVQILDVGKRGGRPSMAQEEIHRLMLSHARQGAVVTRLKGGDPTTFGRLAEELSALRQEDVPVTIVPGITAATAAAAVCGMPLTDRDVAASVTLLTGHRRAAGPQPEMDWAAAARSGTVVVYMGIRQAGENARRLIGAGVAAQTPVAVVRWAGTARERRWGTTLAELEALIENEEINPPSLWIVGEAAGRAVLSGKRSVRGSVAMFRPREIGREWYAQLRSRGWDVLWTPVQTVLPAAGITEAVATVQQEAAVGDWFAFTSPLAVRCWQRELNRHQVDLRGFSGISIAAVGEATKDALRAIGIVPDLTGDGSEGADGLVLALQQTGPPAKIWFWQAADARSGPKERLRSQGWEVQTVATHRKRSVEQTPVPLQIALERRWLDAAIWTSASQVDAVFAEQDWADVRHVAIGAQTAARLHEGGAKNVAVAESPAVDAVADLLESLPLQA